ncbi:MAG: SH3 domain-containing protein [Bacillota bacterium]
MVCVMAACAAAHAASPIEYKSVGAAPAIMYDAPSAKGRKLYIAPRGMPVEVVLTYGEWNKVRDAAGDLSWIEARRLTAKRTVVVKVANAKIRAAADDGAPLVFTADKGVLLDRVEPVAGNWVKVRHRDGQSGYVKAAEVWGE